MLFVLLFVVAMMIVPMAIDVRKHGRNHILRRSAHDVVQLPAVASLLHSLSILGERIRTIGFAVAGLTFVFVALWVVMALLHKFGILSK